jgi:hypothetical protein
VSEFVSLDYALAFAGRGLSIIPVPRPDAVHDGKVPVLPWKRYQTESADEAQLRAWFTAEQNIAIITGTLSSVVVVDADTAEADTWVRRHLPRTPWRCRTAKGRHFYYRHPGQPVRNRARIETRDGRLALDVRGDGGFVIAPGSLHSSGRSYVAEGDWSVPPAQLPTFWVGWLARPQRQAQRVPGAQASASTGAADRARAYLRAIPRPVIGQGSDAATFYAAARLVRGFDLPDALAVELLQEWAPDFDSWWLERKVASAAKYADEPLRGLLA